MTQGYNKIVINNTFVSAETLESWFKDFNIDNQSWKLDIYSFLKTWLDESIQDIGIQTSGSTSLPKTIFHSKQKMILSAKMTCAYFNLSKTSTGLLGLSTKHIGGMMMLVRALVSGMELICVEPSSNPIKQLTSTITFAAMVPMQVNSAIAENPNKLKLIESLIIGGGQVNDNLTKELLSLNIRAYSTFGMTETVSHFALQEIGQDSVFTCLGDFKVSKNENDCMVIHSKSFLSAELVTNDLVNIVTRNSFKWLGRADFAIESGGLKFVPEVLEGKIVNCIKGTYFFSSISDKKLNNALVLVVEGKNTFVDKKCLEQVLTKYEFPKQILFAKQFERTATGKINRSETLHLLIESN